MDILPITVEPGLPLRYVEVNDHVVVDHIQSQRGIYVISLKTLVMRMPLVIESLTNGSIVAVEKTDECVATQWHIQKHLEFEPWFAQGSLRWITGGDADATIKNLNNEHFLQATLGSQMMVDYSIRKCHANRPYTFLFTNRKLRPHRKYLIAKLKFFGLLDRALWSCLENYDTRSHKDFNRVYVEHVNLPEKSLPSPYEIEPEPSWLDGVIHAPQFDDTYFSVVSETVFEYPHSFRTEKTYKPILAGHPFVICANTGFYQDLHRMGFRTFGSLIDESFDTVIDGKGRLDRLIQEVQWLCDQDLDQFWAETRDICLYNQQHAQELHTNQQKTFTVKFQEFMHAT